MRRIAGWWIVGHAAASILVGIIRTFLAGADQREDD